MTTNKVSDLPEIIKDANSFQTMGFVSREKPGAINWPDFRRDMEEQIKKENETNVIILRGLLFFHTEQPNITLGKLREFFTEKAIKLFEIDGYIKINRETK